MRLKCRVALQQLGESSGIAGLSVHQCAQRPAAFIRSDMHVRHQRPISPDAAVGMRTLSALDHAKQGRAIDAMRRFDAGDRLALRIGFYGRAARLISFPYVFDQDLLIESRPLRDAQQFHGSTRHARAPARVTGSL